MFCCVLICPCCLLSELFFDVCMVLPAVSVMIFFCVCFSCKFWRATGVVRTCLRSVRPGCCVIRACCRKQGGKMHAFLLAMLCESPPAETRLTVYRRLRVLTVQTRKLDVKNDENLSIFYFDLKGPVKSRKRSRMYFEPFHIRFSDS